MTATERAALARRRQQAALRELETRRALRRQLALVAAPDDEPDAA